MQILKIDAFAAAVAIGYTYVDYDGAVTTPAGGVKPGLATDCVHLTPASYAVTRPLALAAIAKTLGAS